MRNALALLVTLTSCTSFDANDNPDATPAADASPLADALVDAGLDCSGPSGWTMLGGPIDGNGADDVTTSSITINAAGTLEPVISWIEGNPFEVYVARWDGAAWQQLASPVGLNAGATPANMPRTVFSGSDILLSFSEFNATLNFQELHVQRFTGSAWEQFGPAALSTLPPQLTAHGSAVAPDGTLTVTWSEQVNANPVDSQMPAVSVDAAGQTALPPTLGLGQSVVFLPRLGYDGAGEAILIYENLNVGVESFRFTGGAWAPFGTGGQLIGAGVNPALEPQLGFKDDGTPIAMVAELDNGEGAAGATKGYAFEWDGVDWAPLGPPLNREDGSGVVGRAMLVDETNQTTAAFMEIGMNSSRLYVQRFIGGAWVDVGDQPLSAVLAPELMINAAADRDQCGRVVVAFIEEIAGSRKVYVMRYAE